MAIINHDYKDINFLEQIITKNDGTPLHGEIEMYRRIMKDCENGQYTWHFWHDLCLPIPIKDQSNIQIDFLLVSEIGAIIIEVKGGRVGIDNGQYYLESGFNREYLNRTPFVQADDYMHALFNNHVINKHEMFIATACAFPHTDMESTNNNEAMDQGWKLWDAYCHRRDDYSFESFIRDVIIESKKIARVPDYRKTKTEVEKSLRFLLFNYTDNSKSYTRASLQSIIDWLKIDSISTFESLKKNKRIVIEGGPGTGKTTLAKAYIKKNNEVNGVYLCWNKLLEAKIRYELNKEGLVNCEVYNFASFLLSIQRKLNKNTISFDLINSGNVTAIEELLDDYRQSDVFQPYNYIVIDEAQDVFDKGVIPVLKPLFAIENGVQTGSYMLFYDTEQGYNSTNRKIEKFAQIASQYSAIFELDENKRVPPSKEIAKYADEIVRGEDIMSVINKVHSKSLGYFTVEKFMGVKSLLRRVSTICLQVSDDDSFGSNVLLAHSCTQKEEFGSSIFQRIAANTNIVELTESNIDQPFNKIPFTTILKYKGLECANIYIILDARQYIDRYELYIGITRAMESIHLLIIE